MGSKTVFFNFESDQPCEVVKAATKRALMMVGGAQQDVGQQIYVQQGTSGVNFAFTADFNTVVNIQQNGKSYSVFATINWKPNALVWICLVVGFFVFGILWVVPLLHLFIDPSQAYQQALFQIPNMLGQYQQTPQPQ